MLTLLSPQEHEESLTQIAVIVCAIMNNLAQSISNYEYSELL